MTETEVFDALDRAIAQARPEGRPGLVVALAARLAQLGAGLAVPATASAAAIVDRNLSAKEAARRLGLSRDFLYRNANKLPFTVRIGTRVLFSERGLEKWNAQRMDR